MVKGEFYKTVEIIRKNLMRSTWKDACHRRLSWHLEDQESFPKRMTLTWEVRVRRKGRDRWRWGDSRCKQIPQGLPSSSLGEAWAETAFISSEGTRVKEGWDV